MNSSLHAPVRILLTEDDPGLVDGLGYALQKNGYQIDIAGTVSQTYEYLKNISYQLLILDITLPDGTGYEICKHIRDAGNTVPILFLTALDEEINIIRGLDSGGDDYLTKPFRLGELCSRIRALLRRSGLITAPAEGSPRLSSGNISVYTETCRTYVSGQPVELTGAEYRLLCLFLRNSGQVLTRTKILDTLWDSGGSFVDDNTLSVYIRRLREKIEENPSSPTRLITVRGFGYLWKETNQ